MLKKISAKGIGSRHEHPPPMSINVGTGDRDIQVVHGYCAVFSRARTVCRTTHPWGTGRIQDETRSFWPVLVQSGRTACEGLFRLGFLSSECGGSQARLGASDRSSAGWIAGFHAASHACVLWICGWLEPGHSACAWCGWGDTSENGSAQTTILPLSIFSRPLAVGMAANRCLSCEHAIALPFLGRETTAVVAISRREMVPAVSTSRRKLLVPHSSTLTAA